MKRQLDKLGDHFIGLWRFRIKGQPRLWCVTLHIDGYYQVLHCESRWHTQESTGLVMVDGVLKWAKQQRRVWVREIALLESGKKTTSEVRRGKIVDTTAETLADRLARLRRLDDLIASHEARKT